MISLSVILVNYKRAHDTVECIRSLEQSVGVDPSITVVDNGSNDGSRQEIARECPDVTLIANTHNEGFAEGNNIAIREALGKGGEYILLLNNDTVVRPDALSLLCDALRHRPNVGIVGGKIYYFDRPTTLWFAGGCLNLHSAVGVHRGLDEDDHGQYDIPQECDYVTGCCLLFRRDVAEKIGVLESSYFAYMEDADFCLRARRADFVVLYEPKAVIYHKVSSSSAWDSPFYIYFNLRNKLIFLRRNSSMRRWLPHLPHIVYFYVRQFIRLIVKWRDFSATRAAWLGLIDGLTGNTGVNGAGSLSRLGKGKAHA
jgi:GT2 family glycosyltransferase